MSLDSVKYSIADDKTESYYEATFFGDEIKNTF